MLNLRTSMFRELSSLFPSNTTRHSKTAVIEMTKEDREILENLKVFKKLSSNRKAHPDLLKEKKIILYAATLLESENLKALELCLDILENFVANEQAHALLVSTFGIYEALEALSMRMRNKNEDIYNRSVEITDILRTSAPPAYNTRNRLKMNKPIKKHQLYLLFVEELSKENQHKLEQTVIRIRGVISFLVNIELKRCTIRICPKLNIKDVLQKVYDKCDLKAVVVTKNLQEGTETYCDILGQGTDKSYLEYPEEAHSPKRKAISTAFTNTSRNKNIMKSLVNLWNDSFYW